MPGVKRALRTRKPIGFGLTGYWKYLGSLVVTAQVYCERSYKRETVRNKNRAPAMQIPKHFARGAFFIFLLASGLHVQGILGEPEARRPRGPGLSARPWQQTPSATQTPRRSGPRRGRAAPSLGLQPGRPLGAPRGGSRAVPPFLPSLVTPPGDPRSRAMAAAVCRRRLPWAWLCRSAGQEVGRHYRAAVCAELKQPLAIRDVAPRPVRPHEVRVDVYFCGVNFADNLVCRGQYQEKPSVPFVPGMEFSGVVLETGADVNTVKESLWKIPEEVSLQEAAILPVSYGTAILALEHRARVQPGETVLVTAAAGATGLAVMDVATNVLQAKVIAAAGSDEKCKLAMQRGAQSSVNYTQGSLKEAVRKLVGEGGVNVAVDMVGGDVFLEALRSLAWEGRIVVLGFAGGNIASLPTNLLLLKNVCAMGLYWGRYKGHNPSVFSKSLSSALQYCQQGHLRPYTGSVFKLEEVNDAFLHVIQRKSTGKVLLSLK
uniref:Enoyl reductase (ER) domain-containing protein n=1 Tax=Oryctolagus cuniculus TaxID=9986 RepID=A0A5F9DUR6_RABIT